MSHSFPEIYAPFALTGCSGQVGTALRRFAEGSFLPCDRSKIDLAQPDAIYAQLEKMQPRAIINTASYNQVDKAEEDSETAFTVNATSPAEMARYAFDHDIPFVHFTTDYVFSGEGTAPWRETETTGPLNEYGKSKEMGEKTIARAAYEAMKRGKSPKWIIFRTSWVFDSTHHNFVNRMIELGKERETLTVVDDQIGSPTFADDIAKYVVLALSKAAKFREFPNGIYHLVSEDYVSWHGFAEAIMRETKERGVALTVKNIIPVSTAEYGAAVKRPLNSRLSTDKLLMEFGFRLPSWQDALKRCLDEKFDSQKDAA